MRKPNNIPSVACHACGGEGLTGEYVPELCGEGSDIECDDCKGSGRVELPWLYAVCDQCEGRGTSSAYLGAFTQSEWAEQDDEFKEDYIAGRYDRVCETCDGLRVVAEVDRQRCVPAHLEAWDKECAEEAEYARLVQLESWGPGGDR